MPRNADIRSFFANPQAASQRQSSSSSSASASASFSFSSPPSIAPRQAYAHDAEIAASDEDDDDDDAGSTDSELPDIMAALAPKRRHPVVADPCVTPRAKRTAVQYEGALFSSPLSIRKKYKYDLTALARLHERDEEKLASELRVKQLEDKAKKDAMERERGQEWDTTAAAAAAAAADWDGDDSDGEEDTTRETEGELKRRLLESARAEAGAAEEDEEGRDKMRVVRALERAADAGTGRKTVYLFRQTEPDAKVLEAGNVFPARKAKGPWRILADTQDRAWHFQSGLPLDIQRMFGSLPDEIFRWVLGEICEERRMDLAAEYVKLLELCDDQVRRMITPDVLPRLFKNVGATNALCNLSSTVALTDEIKDPYRDRSWACLESLLELLGRIATSLQSDSRATAMQLVLRLGMDSVAVETFGLAQVWRRTADRLARSVPGREWTSFCQEACTSLYQSTEKATLRYRAINLLGPVQIPESSADLQRRTLDLKRRLASVFFFDELSRADKKPEDTVNIRAVIDRLDDHPFTINAETDYRELAALMLLLNLALGDANSTAITPGSSADFDAEVDELTASMKSMYTRVMPQSHGIHVSRIEAKSAMEMIRDRLVYQLRTKKKPRVADILPVEDKADTSLPRQQMFMKGFLHHGTMEKAMPSIEAEMTA